MNERIDELMIQSGARFEFLHGVHYDDFQYRKFAELIIQDCIEIADGLSKLYSRVDVGFEVGYTMGTARVSKEIRKNFGVE